MLLPVSDYRRTRSVAVDRSASAGCDFGQRTVAHTAENGVQRWAFEWTQWALQARQRNPSARGTPVDRTVLAAKLRQTVQKQHAKRTGEAKPKK